MIYEGGFLNGLYDGTGTLYDRKTGAKVFSGTFRDGKALEEKPTSEPTKPDISDITDLPDIPDLPDLPDLIDPEDDDNKEGK